MFENIENISKEMQDRIVKNKIHVLDSMLTMQSRLEALTRFVESLKGYFTTRELFNESNPWRVSLHEGDYGVPGIDFNINEESGCVKHTSDEKMHFIEEILSRIHFVHGENDWELAGKSENWLNFEKRVEFEGREFEINIYCNGENQLCEQKTKKVWKQVEEIYIDCGMERESDEPEPFIDASGNPIMEDEDG